MDGNFYIADNGIMKRMARPVSLTDGTDDTPLIDNAPIEGSLVGTISEHFREVAESYADQVRESQEATVKAWLYEHGWDGKSIEQAQSLMEGHAVYHFPDGHVEVLKEMPRITVGTMEDYYDQE